MSLSILNLSDQQKTLGLVRQLNDISDTGLLAILVGAGISHSPPASLQTSIAITGVRGWFPP